MLADLAVLLLLIVLNAMFAMSELAIVSARKTRLKPLADQGSRAAGQVLSLQAEPTRFLSTVQIGITVIGVLTGALGADTLGDRLALALAEEPTLAPYAKALSFVVVVIGLSYVTLVLGEILPKRLAMMHPEPLALGIARPLTWLSRATAPFAWILTVSVELALRLVPARASSAAAVTDEEIKILMQEGAASGEFEHAEASIVSQALRLDERRVSGLMTPRVKLEALDLAEPEETQRAKLVASPYSRFPVVDGGFETVVGMVDARELMARALAGAPFDLRAATKPPLYVPDTTTALQAIERFRAGHAPAALVVDEYGEIQGMITLTDLIEALVGELPTAEAGEEPGVTRRADGSWLVDGMLDIEDAAAALSLPPLPEDERGDYQTLAGFVMTQLGRVPQTADQVSFAGWTFEVVDMDGRRIDKVLVTAPREPSAAA